MAEPKKAESSFLMRRITDGKEVIFTVSEFMNQIMQRLKGSDPVNDEVIIGKDTLRISSLESFNGKANLRLSIAGGQGTVKVENANEVEPGVYEAPYKESVTLTPDVSKYHFLRWEGINASEVQDLGEGRFSLLMDSLEKTLIAVFSNE